MNLPSDTPRLPKWMFLLGDFFLLLAAWAIYNQSAKPLTGLSLLALSLCVVAAAVIGVIPFVADYAGKQDEALDNRQRALQALSVTVAASAEQIAIAATGLQGLSESAQDNLAKSEAVSKQMNERIAELQALLSGSKKDGNEAAHKLEAAAKAITAAAASVEVAALKASQDSQVRSDAGAKQVLEKVSELRALVSDAGKARSDAASELAATVKKLAAAAAGIEDALERRSHAAQPLVHVPVLAPEVPPVPPSRIVEIKPAAAPSHSPFEAPASVEIAPAAVPEAVPAPAEFATPVESPSAQAPASESPAADSAAPDPAPKPARKRSPRKPPAPPSSAPAETAPAPQNLVLEAPPAEPAPPPPEPAEPAVSADGATRLIVTAYIGIGNRLFIRGEGPGLSWDKGVPLTFVSIGKWRWETNDATATVRFKLYKNDETECSGLGQQTVEPGAQLELTAGF
jgi:hypothetical protein